MNIFAYRLAPIQINYLWGPATSGCTEMDYLSMGNYLLDKKNQDPLDNDMGWQDQFLLD